LKIRQELTKLLPWVRCAVFFAHPVCIDHWSSSDDDDQYIRGSWLLSSSSSSLSYISLKYTIQ